MRIIDLDLWKGMSVQERDEILAKANAKPSLFRMLIMAWLKKLEDHKKPCYLDTKIFKRHRKFL